MRRAGKAPLAMRLPKSRWARAGVSVAVMAALIDGFAAETASLLDEFWVVVLPIWGPLALLLTVALTVSLGEKAPLPNAVALGVLAGGLMAIMFFLGSFLPFPLELGGRDLNEFGGDVFWYNRLIPGVILGGALGAVVGAVCGLVAWALRFALGQKQVDSEADMCGPLRG